jgi:prepilin peptidase CpaA
MLSLPLPAASPDTLALTRELVLAVLVLVAMVSDLRTFRIPNWLTFGGAAAGLALGALGGEALTALQGLGLGLAMLLPLWLAGVLGAGDVKLMAMVGAFLGFPEIAGAALMVFIAGGALAMGYALWLRQTGRMLRNVQEALMTSAFAISAGVKPQLAAMPSIGKLPYGVGICVGTLAWLVYRHLV